jgi:hypothetical protein
VVVRTIATTATYQLFADASIDTGSLPVVTTSFTRVPLTYYARANGVWTDPTVWSLTANGAAATVYPGKGDLAIVKGFSVAVNTGIRTGNVNIVSYQDQTSLTVDGSNACLTVFGNVTFSNTGSTQVDKTLIVQNSGVINVKP